MANQRSLKSKWRVWRSTILSSKHRIWKASCFIFLVDISRVFQKSENDDLTKKNASPAGPPCKLTVDLKIVKSFFVFFQNKAIPNLISSGSLCRFLLAKKPLLFALISAYWEAVLFYRDFQSEENPLKRLLSTRIQIQVWESGQKKVCFSADCWF